MITERFWCSFKSKDMQTIVKPKRKSNKIRTAWKQNKQNKQNRQNKNSKNKRNNKKRIKITSSNKDK